MANPAPRRGLAVASSLIALAAAGGLAYLGARAATDYLEESARADVSEALHAVGYDWVTVEGDGLIVRLTGTAPDEVQRFRAKSQAEGVVDPDRIVDAMQVAARANLATPDFEIELLNNDQGTSIIGLVPASLDRVAMVSALRGARNSGEISDLVETADYPVPEGWDDAFAFGLKAAGLAGRAKISIGPGKVAVQAITDSAIDKARLEEALLRAKPDGIDLITDITAPRPVITPFTLRFVKDEKGARFDACSADSDAALARILKAGTEAGIPDTPNCRLGLGAPTARWADAAVPAIKAVADLGAGSVTISDTEIALFAPATIAAPAFDEAVGRLESQLPPAFSLSAEHEQKAATSTGPAEFSAVLDPSGVTLRGRIGDQRMREAVESLAKSRFGKVDNALRVDDSVPSGWTLRTIAALEALATLDRGMVAVSPELIRLQGTSGNPSASDSLAARLSQRLGAGARYELSVQYDRRLDPLIDLPSGVDCVDRLNVIMQEAEIGFEPSKASIAGDPKPVLERLATVMAECGEYQIELGGHTDSQGSDGFNTELSQNRAQAVLAAMGEHGIKVANLTAKGYGESRPVASNETDEGREANRRIEFTLLSDHPTTTTTIAPAKKISGVTDTAEAAAAAVATATSAAATGATSVALGEAAEAPVAPAAPAVAPTIAPATLDKVVEATTMPALEAAFPDNREGALDPQKEGSQAAAEKTP